MPDPGTCKHLRTQVIAKDKDEQYFECLYCGAILEAGEIEEAPSGFDESLSDAYVGFVSKPVAVLNSVLPLILAVS